MEETKHDNPTSSPSSSPTSDSPTSSPNSSPTNDSPTSSPTSDNPNPSPTNDNNRPSHHTTTTNNGPSEHSDSTMSNPVNDKVDTSEKSGESAEDNTPFDLSYFDGIYKTKEKDDPLDLSYFESPYDKNKLEDYLKSNVESGNQLAYNAEDFTESSNRINNIQVNSNPLYEAIFNERESFDNAKAAVNSILEGMSRDVNSGGRVKDRLLESLNMINEVIDRRESSDRGGISSPYDEGFRNLKQEIDFAKQKAEDINTHGVTKNTGISSDSERQQINDALEPAKERLMSAYESGDSTEIENAKQNYERIANRVKQEFEGSEVSRRAWNFLNKPEVFYQKMEESYGPTPTRTETPETPTSTTPDEPARAEETLREPEVTSETPATEDDLASTPRETHEERDVTPTEEPWVTESETPETPTSTETSTEITSTEESSETSEDEIPEEIDTEPSEETHDVMEAMEHLDDSGRWWEFGSEDYERTRHQIARISPTAEEEFMDFADLINDVVNGSAGDKVKAVLKLISKAAWDTFNILPKVCVDIAKDIVYRLIKGDYDTSGLTEGEQKQVERFSHNKQNVNMMNAMLNTMDKPINSSVRGKGRGQATDESDYNEGLIEQTNEVVSDVTKKYIINHPWVFKAIKRW